MALIQCPECRSEVSDRAPSCPRCGYPLAQQRTYGEVLANRVWEARSAGLAAQSLTASFHDNGTLEGILANPPDDLVIRPQRVRGKWHFANPLLMISYAYATVSGGSAEAEFAIEITQMSETRLTGIDKYLRLWEFERRS